MKTIENITGLVLAGGQSSRMGEDKALVKWHNKRLVDHVIDSIFPLCNEVLVSSNNPELSFLSIEVLPDKYKNIGPIAGIEAGLRKARNSLVFIVSCDTPLLPTEMFHYMIQNHDNYDISLASHDGINEPMIGIYSKQIHHVLISAIENGLNKPPEIIRKTNWQEINIHKGLNFYSPDMFRNFNRPEDINTN